MTLFTTQSRLLPSLTGLNDIAMRLSIVPIFDVSVNLYERSMP
jgi:hypothetical protein